jgi:hypothetical protein
MIFCIEWSIGGFDPTADGLFRRTKRSRYRVTRRKIDRLISIVLGTENFVDLPNSLSKSKAENSDGVS